MKIYCLLVQDVSANINRSLSKSLSMQITQPKPIKFSSMTYSRHAEHGCGIRLKRQEIKVFRCFLRATDVNIARNVVLALSCFCSFNLYNLLERLNFFPLSVNYKPIMLVFYSVLCNLLKVWII